jgi:hypothetical protein
LGFPVENDKVIACALAGIVCLHCFSPVCFALKNVPPAGGGASRLSEAPTHGGLEHVCF